jgi:cyclopropane fatty-acyl-phospholipid synthase-like methyltransferase
MTVFEAFYRADQRPPWDLDGPTPFVREVESRGGFRGVVLDAGCGTGENALYLAARGHTVFGIDAAPTAIARARAKADQRHLHSVTFVEADACEIPGFTNAFDTVLDCGFFHVLSPHDQARYVQALNRATRPAAILHLMAFSDHNPPRTERRPAGCFTHGVSETELREAFSPEWDLESLQEVRSTLQVSGGEAREVRFWQARLNRKSASYW